MANLKLAVVVNPRKFDDPEVPRAEVFKLCAGLGLDEPMWFEAKKSDHGRSKAKKALKQGAEVVAVLGGDGTIRGVASALVGTKVPLGVLPGGTGNLFARNLGVPLDDRSQALLGVVRGRERRVDVGRVKFDKDDEELFLVMAGMGVDGAAMKNANKQVKSRLGWPAYVVSGVGGMFSSGFGVSVGVPGRPPLVQHAASVIVGNCGTLTGGLDLMPEARLDDGKLDAVVVAPSGLLGWAAVVAAVASRDRRGHRMLVRRVARRFTIYADEPVEAQLDGESVGRRSRLKAWAEPGALRVRVG